MLQYLLKLSISLSIVYLFYQLFLRRLTFYSWNRWYLLIYSMVCFVIPVINVFTIIVKEPALRESAIINYIPAITQMTTAEGTPVAPSAGTNWLLISAMVFITGMLLMIARLVVQYYSLFKMRAKAVLLYDDKVKLYHIDEPVIPFSFGRGIYVNQHQHSEQELKDIIRHEFIHVKQRHSLDIIWSELLCILNWYNPFAWLLRHDIRQNLEFIADQQVLQTGLDRKQYQYLLLKVIGVNSFSIATNFNFSSLKKRIAMMNKTRSARVHLLRFLFMLPLLVVVLLAFRNATQKQQQQQQQQQPLSGTLTDTIPLNKKEHADAWKNVLTIDVNEINNAQKVTIRSSDGKVETYDLTVPKEKEAFQRKYGSLPKPPAPPAPPVVSANGEKEVPVVPAAPGAPELAKIPEHPEAPATLELAKIQPDHPEAPATLELAKIPDHPEAPASLELAKIQPDHPEAPATPELARIQEEPEAPVPPPTPAQVDCPNKKGYCVTIADNQGEFVVIVKDKNNKIVEAVPLTDWDKNKGYEEKYGETPSRRWLPKHVMGTSTKKVTRLEVKPVPTANVKRVTILELKPVTRPAAKPVPAVNEKKVITLKLKPATGVEAKPELQLLKERLKNDTVIIAQNATLWARRKTAVTAVPAKTVTAVRVRSVEVKELDNKKAAEARAKEAEAIKKAAEAKAAGEPKRL